MLIIPAIDLLKNKVVRLEKGKIGKAKVYSDNPVETAKRWADYGAKLIHIVDLDTAFDDNDNVKIIKEIASKKIDIQVGGGIRSFDKARDLVNSGVKRPIIDSKTVDKEFLSKVIREFNDKITIGVNVLGGKFMKPGWQTRVFYILSYRQQRPMDNLH